MRRFIVLLLAATSYGADLPHIVNTLRSEVRPDEAMVRMGRLYSTDRWFTFPKFEQTTRYIANQMKVAGLKKIELGGARADGKSQAGFWTMPLAWDVHLATLEIVEPVVSKAQRRLADYQTVPASLGMWSGPTPPGGVTAELVEVKLGDIPKLDLRGKIVMAADPRNAKAALAKAGAIGAINTWTENPSLLDGHQWINGWGDASWGFLAGDAPLLSFSLSPRKTAFVQSLLAKGSVKVRAVVDSRYYEGVYPWVTGIISGTDPTEEVLLLGHAFEQGAQDNATGVSAMLEAMASINRLIAAGKLNRPRRSMRLLVMGELYGSMDYVAKHPERMRNTVAAMCLDTPAASYDIAGTEYSFYMNPHVAASWVDALILRVAQEYFPLVNRPWHEKPHTAGTDTFLSDPLIGVPTTWAYSGSGVETHHNSEDTPDRVDPRSLRDISVVTASFVYTAAAIGAQDAVWLAPLLAARADRRIKAAEAVSEEAAIYMRARQKQAYASIRRIAPNAKLASFGIADESRKLEGASIVVKRKRFGTLPLDDLAVDKREDQPSGAWSVRLITALYWCDGKRTLDEVIRLTRLELGPDKFDYVSYFRFLARHGYVEIHD